MKMVKNKVQSRFHNVPQSQSGTNINSDGFSNSNTFRTYQPDVHRNTYNYGSRYKYERFPRKLPYQNATRKSNYHVNTRGGPFARMKKKPTTSPPLGSEEHALLKIKQTSAIIMRQILNPEDNIIAKSIKDNSLESEQEPISNTEKTAKRTMKVSKSKSKEQSKETSYSVEEIHNKIMHHLTNLNNGKKRNLINSNSTGYDELIQKIIKQKRLEISRALRNISSDYNDTQSTDFINSMIPDMIGIKIEDLPQEFIEELRCTFDISVQGDFSLMNNDHSEVGINYPPNTMPFSSTVGDSSYDNASSSDVFFIGEPNVVIDLTDADDSPVDFSIQAVQYDITQNPNSHRPEEISPKKEVSDKNMNSNGDFTPKPFSTDFSTTDVIIPSNQCISNQFTEERNEENSQKGLSENNTSHPFSNDDVMVDNWNTEHEMKFENIIYSFDHEEIHDVENSRANLDIDETQNTRLKKQMLDSEEPSSSTGVQMFDEMAQTSKVDENVVEIRREDIYNDSIEINLKKECQETCEDENDSEEVNMSIEEVKVEENEICKVCEYSEISTQTKENPTMSMKSFLEQAFPKPPKNFKAAVKRMTSIDKYISDLILYRKNVLNPYLSSEYNIKVRKDKNRKQRNCSTLKGNEVNKKEKKKNGKVMIHDERIVKKKKSNSEEKQSCSSEVEEQKNDSTENDSNPSSMVEIEDIFEGISRTDVSATELTGPSIPVQDLLVFQEIHESFLDLKVYEDRLLASTSNGRIHFFSLQNGCCVNTLEVSEKAVSSLLCLRAPDEKLQIFVGTLDRFLRVYNFHSQCLLKLIKLEENVQCMSYNWNYIFIGGSGGSIMRYSVKKRAIEYEDKYYNDTIFVLKPILEGARRVLLIGSRNSPVVIRDAMNGLHLRTMQDLVCPTVYSLVMKNNMVYCGTTNLDILVFNFHSGQLEHKLKATNAKGISCLKIFGRLLFASCHSGDVFVYNIENNTFLGIIEGPGGVILSMEIIVNQIVVGTMSSKFVSMPIPQHILREK